MKVKNEAIGASLLAFFLSLLLVFGFYAYNFVLHYSDDLIPRNLGFAFEAKFTLIGASSLMNTVLPISIMMMSATFYSLYSREKNKFKINVSRILINAVLFGICCFLSQHF